MLKFVKFYDEDNDFEYFEMAESRSHKFETFVSNLHKKEIDKLLAETNDINKVELSQKYKNLIEKSISSSKGFSETINLDSVESRHLKTIIELKSFAINYDEVLIEYLCKQIKYEIGNSIPKTMIHISHLDELIDFILSEKDIHVTRLAQYDIERALKERGIYDSINIECFNSTILSGYYILGKNMMSFGCKIDLNIDNLSPIRVSEKAEEYKTQDGRYIYEGAFLLREELENIISKQYALLTLKLQYKVNSDEIKVYEIDYADLSDMN